MKANELRILNYYLDKVGQECIFTYNLFEPLLIGKIKVNGIPLTEEWLVKLGFEKEEADAEGIATWNEWYLGNFEIDSEGTEAGYENKFHYPLRTGKVDIKYVHQLQNLYFATTGKELTVKLEHGV